jgi:uncharacterized membrane protein YedE/YeeE
MDIARWLAIGVLATGLAGCASGPRRDGRGARQRRPGPGAALLQAVHYRFEPQPPVAGQPAPAQVRRWRRPRWRAWARCATTRRRA